MRKRASGRSPQGIRERRAAKPRAKGIQPRLFTNPLTASPLAFTASQPKQVHSRAKSRQLRKLYLPLPPHSCIERTAEMLFSLPVSTTIILLYLQCSYLHMLPNKTKNTNITFSTRKCIHSTPSLVCSSLLGSQGSWNIKLCLRNEYLNNFHTNCDTAGVTNVADMCHC